LRDFESLRLVTQKGEALSTLLQSIGDEGTMAINSLHRAAQFWYAVQTKPRHEKKVALELKAKGIDSYLPLQNAVRQWSDRRQSVSLPLFPGYVFLQTGGSVQERVGVLQTNGIINFVGVRGQGISIPGQQIQAIQTILGSGAAVDPYPYLREGKRVRIRGGSLNGVEGVLVAKNNDMSLVISVEIIQRSLAVRVTGFQVEAA
jgi:transcription antitermination factor NusG